VTDECILTITETCSELKRLGLAYCTALTDEAVACLIERADPSHAPMHVGMVPCPKLEWLNIRDCPMISAEVRKTFAEKRPMCSLLFNKV
jgi:hypothetical protein